MPNKCAAVGCKSGSEGLITSSDLSFHSFPLENNNLLRQWMHRISRDNYKPSRHSVLCSLHFSQHDFVYDSTDSNNYRKKKRPRRTLRKRYLKPDAVPTIFPNLPNYFSSFPSEPRSTRATSISRLVNENFRIERENEAFMQSDSFHSIPELLSKIKGEIMPSGFKIISDQGVHDKAHFILLNDEIPLKIIASITINADLQVTLCQNEIVLPVSKVKHIIHESCFVNCVSQILNLMAFLKGQIEESKPCDIKDICVDYLRKYVEEIEFSNHELASSVKFLLEQLVLLHESKFHRRYSPELHVLAYILFSTSSACYQVLRNSSMLCLPSISTLKEITRKVDPVSGIETSQYLKLRIKQLRHFEVNVSLVIDEIYVGQRTEMSGGRVYGLTDSGDVAQTALCFMIKSLSSGYRDIVSIYPVKGLNAETLFNCYNATMALVHNAGFKVVALIVDNACSNRRFYQHFLCEGEMKSRILNQWTNEDIFLLFDPTHNVKNLYNNFQCRKIFVCPPIQPEDGNGFTANFRDLHDLYHLEASRPLRIAHKLALTVLNPKSTEKTSMKFASSIFHESTIAGLRNFGKTGTVQFLELVLRAWNIMNVRTPFVGQAKRDSSKEPIKSCNDRKLEYLLDFADFLERWKESEVSEFPFINLLLIYYKLSSNFTVLNSLLLDAL